MKTKGCGREKQIIFFIMILSLIITGSIFDYQITDTLNGKAVYASKFFELFGEFPLNLGLVFGISYFCVRNKIKNKTLKIISNIFNFTLGIFASFFTFFNIAIYINREGKATHAKLDSKWYIICLILGIILFSILTVFLKTRSEEKLREYRKIAIAMIFMWIFLYIGSSLLKFLWCRPRFSLIKSGKETFKQWYILNPGILGTNYQSFPSGHVCKAFGILSLTLFFPKDKNEKIYNRVLILAFVWGSLTGLSRLFLGQHFLTDVIFAGIYSIIVFYIIKKKLEIN